MKAREIHQSDEKIFTEILSGKYRNFYLIYNRKSTDEPDNQKNSIKYQNAENGRYAYREKLPVAKVTLKGFCTDGIISEKHTGFKEDDDITFTKDGLVQYRVERQKFQRLMHFLSLGLFKGVICLCWDRISRNKSDNALITKIMRKGFDVRFVFATYDKTSSGALHMDIDGMFAEQHSRVTSEKVKTTTFNLRENGICTYRAPIGYLNLGEMEHKPFDPERYKIVQQIFELYATGEWAYADLAQWANKEGLTTVPMRRRRTKEEILADEGDDETEIAAPVSRPITTKHIYNILKNPFYTGKILDSHRVYVPSKSHEALVTEELFNKVQSIRKRKRVSVHYAEKLNLPLRGFIRCKACGRTYTPYIQKDIQYFSIHCKVSCSNDNKNFSLKFVEDKAGELIANLSFTDDELTEIDARAKTDIALLEENRHKQIESNERKKKKIREDLKYLRSEKLTLLKTGVYTPESFLEEEDRLNGELFELQEQEQASDAAMHGLVKEVVKLSELLKTAHLHYVLANPREKEEIIKIIFSELLISGNTLEYKCKNGFKALESRFLAVCDPTTWLSELYLYENNITMSIQDLGRIILL
jgi:DNA invertase Pin-like site-specific DNA recombinase